jgi:hypothetical protein
MKKKRTYHYQIDEEGDLIFEGSPLTDQKTIHFFLKNLKPRPKKNEYLVLCQGEENIVTCVDAPLVTQSLKVDLHPTKGLQKVILCFKGGLTEELRPDSLEVGEHNILYFWVRNKQIRGRFSRKCYHQIAEFIKEKEGQFYLEFDGQLFLIKQATVIK